MSCPEGTAALLLMAVDGHPQDVEDRAARMARFCREQGANPVLRAKTAEEAEGLWRARKVISPALLKVKPHKVSEDVAVPLGAIPALITGLTRNFPAPGAHHPQLRPCRGRQHPRQRAL